jgi:hypothetical protein
MKTTYLIFSMIVVSLVCCDKKQSSESETDSMVSTGNDTIAFVTPSTTGHYAGSINGKGKIQINMGAIYSVPNWNNEAVGTYRNQADSGMWILKGHYNDTTSSLLAQVEHVGAETEYFEGVVDKNTIVGNWRMGSGNSSPFRLTRDKVSDLSFKVRYTTDSVEEIEIYRDKAKIQRFKVSCKLGPIMYSFKESPPGLHMEDFNFDGYPDLALGVSGSGGDFIIRCLYVYNPQEDKFNSNTDIETLANPDVDMLHNMLIDTGSHMGMGGLKNDYYTFRDGRFVLVKTVVDDPQTGPVTTTY